MGGVRLSRERRCFSVRRVPIPEVESARVDNLIVVDQIATLLYILQKHFTRKSIPGSGGAPE